MHFISSVIRSYLEISSCKLLVQNLVISHTDYANGLLFGVPKADINRLQRIQNMAAKLVLGCRKFDSASAALKQLHWLPVRFRILFKIAVTTFKCLNGSAPSYLSDLVQPRKLVKLTGQ